jgi:carbon storage regulator CsrA
MLVLARKTGQQIVIPELGITFKILRFKSAGIVSVGIEAPEGIKVHRKEIHDLIVGNNPEQEAEKFPSVRPSVRPSFPAEIHPPQPTRIWAKPRHVTGKSQSAGEQGTQQEGQQS